MSKYGKKLLSFLESSTSENFNNSFIGIVRSFVDKDSELLETYSDSDQYREYIDNRNVVFVTPIDKNANTIEPAIFLNSHEMDVPILGEAVLCMQSELGNIIIDRLSLNQFALNYDSYDFLLDKLLVGSEVEIEYPEEFKEEINRESFRDVAPFFPKMGSKNILGRNNQYFIFDHGEHRDATANEKEHTKDGDFIKVGFRVKGNQTDSREDPTLVTFARRAKLSKMLTEEYRSKYKQSEEVEPNEGLGAQSDQIMFIGRKFTVIFSLRDMLIEAKEKLILKSRLLILENDETDVVSNKINLGSKNARSPYVKGDELLNILKEIIFN